MKITADLVYIRTKETKVFPNSCWLKRRARGAPPPPTTVTMELSCEAIISLNDSIDVVFDPLIYREVTEPVQVEIDAVKRTLLELCPDIEHFREKLFRARSSLHLLDVRELPLMKKLVCQLEALQCDITELRGCIKIMLISRNADTDPLTLLSIPSQKVSEDNADDPGDVLEDVYITSNDDDLEKACTPQSLDEMRKRESKPSAAPSKMSPDNLPVPKSDKRKVCYICGERIHNRVCHMDKYHPGQKAFSCSKCDLSFDVFKDFQKHRSTHKVTVFKCDLCNKVLKNQRNIRDHVALHINENFYTCDICGKVFRHQKSVSACKHVQTTKIGTCSEKIRRQHREEKKEYPALRKALEKSFTKFQICKSILSGHLRKGSKQQKSFSCAACGKGFWNASNLKRHMTFKHDQSTIHRCDFCAKTFSSVSKLKNHRRSHLKGGGKFSCNFCMNTFRFKSSLDEHINVHTGEKPFECEMCHQKFPSLSSKENHRYLVHVRGYLHFKCVICDKKFPSKFSRETHYLKKHTQEELSTHNIVVKMLACDICGKFMRKEYMPRHKDGHSIKVSSFCEICGKEFKDLARLKRHTLLHLRNGALGQNEIGPNVCNICGKGYSNAAYLEQHKLFHSQSAVHEKDDECNDYGKKFTCKSALEAHKVVHTGVRNEVCDICGKAYEHKTQLAIHRKVHTEKRGFECTVCAKRLSSRQALQVHEVIHTNIKAFKCEVCGMAFNLARNLKRHSTIHTGERPFQCDYCGKRFREKHILQNHCRIHTGEKPFQCAICNKQFSDPSTLAKHKAVHTKKVPLLT
ncbi:Zinc finger protein 728 [Plakobranchus ocellatus]|uniref:Zinc finger protein 728 n=1 Tax=Plakobranchus ocellatus TaxID=259542 RepID=A0AAV3XY45_9GAST|nr:Zinc finger protein 728 [Plakobranchus ocellatus]